MIKLQISLLVVAAYTITLLFLSFPFSPLVPFSGNSCKKTKRVDYIFPARQIFCFLDAEINYEQ